MDIHNISSDHISCIARKAGKEILDIYYGGNFNVSYKEDNSPLTLADKRSHRIIDEGLKSITSELPILSEEGMDVDYKERSQWKTFWLVDPLDGTKEFVKRNGEFTVNIALIHEKYPVLGVIYVPVTDTMYYTSQNRAYKQVAKNKILSLKIISENTPQTIVAVGSRSHVAKQEEILLKSMNIKKIIGVGSSLKFCKIAEQESHVYYRYNPTMEWDTAAGQAVVEAAGGVVLDHEGKRFSYNKESLRNQSFICLNIKIEDISEKIKIAYNTAGEQTKRR